MIFAFVHYRLVYNTWKNDVLNTYTKPPEGVDIISVHHEVFTAGSLENLMMYLKYPLIRVQQPNEGLCDMRYAIRTAISHGHIK